MNKKVSILVTMGDPEGVGPEVIVQALEKIDLKNVEVVVLGERSVFKKISKGNFFSNPKIIFESVVFPKKVSSGRKSLLCLNESMRLLKTGFFSGIVTAPVSKERIIREGFAFRGQTEFFASGLGVNDFAMMLFHEKLRVTLTTIHSSLKNVSTLITKKSVTKILRLTANSLISDFGLEVPRLAVCGLNPHAGENGILGDEEKKIISPVIKSLQKSVGEKKVKFFGPMAADSVFYAALEGKYDAVVAHYHDQGLVPVKTTGFFEAVNMTIGLPFVRTSPDHGTAFDIAGKGLANATSMQRALEAVLKISKNRKKFISREIL